jgi:hypothetical protein
MCKVTRLTIVLVVAAIAAMLIDASPTYARPGGHGPSHHHPGQAAGHHSPAQGQHAQHGQPGPAGHPGPNPQPGQPGPQPPQGPPWAHGPHQPPHGQQAGQPWHQPPAPWHGPHAPANWQGHPHGWQNAQAWWNNYHHGPQPFTPAWYAQHPNAWHATHPYADEWAVATAAALGSWLGWAYAPEPSYSSTTIIYQDAPDAPDETDTLAEVYTDASPSDVALPSGDWLPLGVYSLLAAPDLPPMQLVQLSVDRQGILRGVYYDVVTNTSHDVVGSLDADTHEAQWTLQSNPNLAFRAAVDQLTQPEGVVEVTLPGGVEQWHLVRMENTGQ